MLQKLLQATKDEVRSYISLWLHTRRLMMNHISNPVCIRVSLSLQSGELQRKLNVIHQTDTEEVPTMLSSIESFTFVVDFSMCEIPHLLLFLFLRRAFPVPLPVVPRSHSLTSHSLT